MLDKYSKIYVAGHHGLVGSAIWNNLKARGYNNLVGRSHKELDLTDQVAVKAFFDKEQPDAVVLAAAFVGGIMANSLYRADFIMMNMKIQCNVISEACPRGKKTAVPRLYLYLSEECASTHERGLSINISSGIYQ
jgi:GDP-L-fucose synthase